MKPVVASNVYIPSSAFVKSILAAQRKKDGVALAEGERTALLALHGSWSPKALILESIFSASEDSREFRMLATKKHIDVYTFNRAAMEKVSSCETAPSVAVLVAPPAQEFTRLQAPPRRVLVLDRVADPGNAGTLIRSAAAFGFTVMLTAGSVSLTNEKLIRASAGNCFLPDAVFEGATSVELCAFLISKKYEVLAFMPRAEKTLAQLDASSAQNLALILGNETAGVDAEVWSAATPVRIPMRKNVESLNVAMSGAIALYELSRPSFL
ncbi:MAG: RNA methyltransferase [Candidatus Sumerlaeota bacterium]